MASKGRKENAMRSAKEYLEQVRKQADRVEDLKQDVQYLDDGMASIGSTSFCKTDGHSGSPQAGFVLLVERKDAKQQKLDFEKNHLAELMWTRWKTPVRRRRVKRVLGYIRLKIYIAEKADKVVVLLYYKKYRKNRKLL